MTELKAWVRQNSTLVYFLIAQAVALVSGGAWALSYMVTLETRVMTMETRGAQYTVARIAALEQRITVLEEHDKTHDASIERIKDVMTRELGKSIK
jgi:hypothetical protein